MLYFQEDVEIFNKNKNIFKRNAPILQNYR